MTERAGVLGRDIFDVFPDNPDDPAADGVRNLRASLQRVIEFRRADAMSVQKYDVRRPESAGGAFETRYWSPVNSPVLGADGELRYIIHRVEDVTEFVVLKQTGREREERNEALRIRTEQMEAEIFLRAKELADANQRLREANEELAGLCNQIALLMAQAGDKLQLKEGREDHWDFIGKPIPPGDMLARIGRLMSEHKELEEQLRQSQKMDAIGRLAGGVAHDFNNLLTVITGYAELMRQTLPPDLGAEELAEIEVAAVRASSLTTKLLAFSRKQPVQPRVLDLNSVIAGMEHMLRRLIGENVQLVTILASGLGKVKADPSQIDQVLLNLAVNASDAMPNGGRLIIETKNAHLGPGEVESLATGHYVVMSIRDTGHGMDATTISRIFEPFFTTKQQGKGTGLGLSIVYGIVQQNCGGVMVESQPGEGSVFRIYLPKVEGHGKPGPGAAGLEETAAVKTGSGTVLLVEDELPLRKLMHSILTAAGYEVIAAANGEEAVAMSDAHSGQIDLLLSDVLMPGMNGTDLAVMLEQRRPRIRTVFMSGYDRNLVNERKLHRVAGFVPKPFTPRDLLSKVGELLAVRTVEPPEAASGT
jgi:signal transduction histidine kinase/CheY-like chemotaxis protein